ncbi:hypothetical protein NQZ68_033666 [Dissostichus eleginoides]|nr:hypothetical protein NQZ68_033666 [Dissostichus eleginoides]
MASVSTTPRLNPNSVKSLIQEPLERRSLADKLQPQEPIKTLGAGEQQRLATEVCETILMHAMERFSFTQHLISMETRPYQFFMENNVQSTFPDTFLRNTMSQDRLNALAMLSMEKKLVRDIPDFNKKVIERFATQKERRAKFLYK